MQGKWYGLAPKRLGMRPTLPSNFKWARVAQPGRIADVRTLIKDDTDEALREIFEQQT